MDKQAREPVTASRRAAGSSNIEKHPTTALLFYSTTFLSPQHSDVNILEHNFEMKNSPHFGCQIWWPMFFLSDWWEYGLFWALCEPIKYNNLALSIFCPAVWKLNLCQFSMALRLLFLPFFSKIFYRSFKNVIKYFAQIIRYSVPYNRASLNISEIIGPNGILEA